MSNSKTSTHATNYKYLRKITRDRLLHEMLGMTKKGASCSTGKVLIMDSLTVKIMSHACKMSEIIDAGVTLVDDINNRRQALHTLDAVYFIQPTMENVIMFMADMAGKLALYKQAFVFFSSALPTDLLNHIRCDGSVWSRIAKLNEINLEYIVVDRQCFITDNERAIELLLGDYANSHRAAADEYLHLMGARIATVFASMREFPTVRWRAAKSLDTNTIATYRDHVPANLAASIWHHLMRYKDKTAEFPQMETCDLLIVDRSVDLIAPVIHEWTYDAMCHDLLDLKQNKYVHEVPSKTEGKPSERKVVLLEDHDPICFEFRHLHIADASERLHGKMSDFIARNKAAKFQFCSRDGNELSTRDLQRMVQALPQYNEQIDKLSLHVEIACKINRIIREQGLKDIGQLEQDLVFGQAGSEELVNFLRMHEDLSSENMLRLLMVYAAVYPDKFEGGEGSKLMQLAELSPDDMNAISNMRLLDTAPETYKHHRVRKECTAEEREWQLSRFRPMIEELVEKLITGALPRHEYPCLNDPGPKSHETAHSVSLQCSASPVAYSIRSRRSTLWPQHQNSDDWHSSSSILRHSSSDSKMGKRIFVFIVGGATRSELQVCHKLTKKLNREVILGSTSIDDPSQFITKLKKLPDKSSLYDLL